jgi:hypothetical protein
MSASSWDVIEAFQTNSSFDKERTEETYVAEDKLYFVGSS